LAEAERPEPAPGEHFDDDQLERARRLFAQACQFVTAAVSPASLPPSDLPEAAFAGRSNVGKSSLINALTGRKTLARTSRTPGRTQQINFFSLGERLMLVDLPGYGYARASKTKVAAWTRLTQSYLRGRPNLRRVLLLADARHGLKENDRRAMALLDEAGVSYQIVLTKLDKLSPAARASRIDALAAELKAHPAAYPEIAATSAETGEGIAHLKAVLASLAREAC
jgi:GTP-binding protein